MAAAGCQLMTKVEQVAAEYEVLDFVAKWSAKTELPAKRVVGWLGVARGKFYQWKQHYGRSQEHNGQCPVTTGSSRGSGRRSLTTSMLTPSMGTGA